jgi:hypothetical protein
MICQFCKQDVSDPCRSENDIERRASEHVERCENALHGHSAMHRDGGESDADM